MASVSHGQVAHHRDRPRWAEVLKIRELWASLAITMMWLAVVFSSVYGPDFVSSNGSGSHTTTIPSGIFVALFAFLASASMSKYAFRNEKK